MFSTEILPFSSTLISQLFTRNPLKEAKATYDRRFLNDTGKVIHKYVNSSYKRIMMPGLRKLHVPKELPSLNDPDICCEKLFQGVSKLGGTSFKKVFFLEKREMCLWVSIWNSLLNYMVKWFFFISLKINSEMRDIFLTVIIVCSLFIWEMFTSF